jgi:hypothetical protein
MTIRRERGSTPGDYAVPPASIQRSFPYCSAAGEMTPARRRDQSRLLAASRYYL